MDEVCEILSAHADTVRLVSKKLSDAEDSGVAERVFLHLEMRTAREIDLLYNRNGNQNVPIHCECCGVWLMDEFCECSSECEAVSRG